MVDARNATAGDFDRAAQRNANAFWFWLVLAIALWWFTAWWWAIAAGVVALVCGGISISCTRTAGKLRSGTYPIFNPNNGAPDGDASNWNGPQR